MTDKGMPDKIWIDETSEDCDGFVLGRYDQKYGNVDQCYIRSDIVEELLMTLEWYNDGRDPVVSEVMSRINAIMEGK